MFNWNALVRWKKQIYYTLCEDIEDKILNLPEIGYNNPIHTKYTANAAG